MNSTRRASEHEGTNGADCCREGPGGEDKYPDSRFKKQQKHEVIQRSVLPGMSVIFWFVKRIHG
jgi:hypothetical protein